MKQNDFENIFRAMSLPCMVLAPKDQQYFIIDANKLYLQIMGSTRASFVDNTACDVFIKNSSMSLYVANLLMESLQRVRHTLEPDRIELFRFDIPIPENERFQEKYWQAENIPVLSESGELEYIFHILQDVNTSVVSREGVQRVPEFAKKQQQYWHFIETNSDGLYSLDMEGNFTSANEGIVNIAGVKREELLRMNFLPFCSREDHDLILEHFQLAIQGEAQKFEANFISGKKRKMILEISLLPIQVKSEIVGAYGIARDITDFRAMEQERRAAEASIKEQEEVLRRSEQKFRALVQEGSDLLGILDEDGGFTFVSETTTSAMGVPAKEFMGKSAFNHVHPEDLEGIVDQFETLREHKRAKLGPFRFRDGQGNWRWLETIATDLTDDPAVRGVVTNSRDVTEFKSNEEALKLANDRFKLAMKATSDMIWDWDIREDKVHRSQIFSKVYGYSNKKRASMEDSWFSKILFKDQERVRLSLFVALEDPQQKKWKEEYRLVKANGEIASIVDRGYIIRNTHGKAIRMVGSAADITEARQTMKKIKKQNKLLKEIAWEQSHIVRAPLARLKGLIQLMELESFEELNKQEIWKHIESSAGELDEIVRSIVNRTAAIES